MSIVWDLCVSFVSVAWVQANTSTSWPSPSKGVLRFLSRDFVVDAKGPFRATGATGMRFSTRAIGSIKGIDRIMTGLKLTDGIRIESPKRGIVFYVSTSNRKS